MKKYTYLDIWMKCWKFSLTFEHLIILTPLFCLNWSVYDKEISRAIFWHGISLFLLPKSVDQWGCLEFLWNGKIVTDEYSLYEHIQDTSVWRGVR